MSKFNYSFARHPDIKQEVDSEKPDCDMSMMSFRQRFESMAIDDNNDISGLSFKKHN